jgi:hypothetical protein
MQPLKNNTLHFLSKPTATFSWKKIPYIHGFAIIFPETNINLTRNFLKDFLFYFSSQVKEAVVLKIAKCVPIFQKYFVLKYV